MEHITWKTGCRYEDNIKINIKEAGHVDLDCIHLAVDRVQQWAVHGHGNKLSQIS
jgi:uncharacterized membrane protein